MEIFLYIIFAIAGLLIGSFLNVCIDRLPARKSIIKPPSHCDSCSKGLTGGDLIPVFSYLRYRGKCRYCGAPIPIRVLWVETITGALFALLFWKYGLTAEFGIIIFYTCVFIILFVIDLERGIILNVITYPAMAIALGISFLMPEISNSQGLIHFTGSGFLNGGISSLIAGASAFILFFVIVIASRGGMGEGDVTMAGLVGLVTGYPNVITALLIGILTGGIVAVVLLISKVRKRKEGIPFGPFLAVGAVAALIWGPAILNWYLGIFR